MIEIVCIVCLLIYVLSVTNFESFYTGHTPCQSSSVPNKVLWKIIVIIFSISSFYFTSLCVMLCLSSYATPPHPVFIEKLLKLHKNMSSSNAHPIIPSGIQNNLFIVIINQFRPASLLTATKPIKLAPVSLG